MPCYSVYLYIHRRRSSPNTRRTVRVLTSLRSMPLIPETGTCRSLPIGPRYASLTPLSVPSVAARVGAQCSLPHFPGSIRQLIYAAILAQELQAYHLHDHILNFCALLLQEFDDAVCERVSGELYRATERFEKRIQRKPGCCSQDTARVS